jgi:hypothetical protein
MIVAVELAWLLRHDYPDQARRALISVNRSSATALWDQPEPRVVFGTIACGEEWCEPWRRR